MKSFHAFELTYRGPTNSRGSKVSIKSLRFDQSVAIPYDYTKTIMEMAETYLNGRGFVIFGCAETPKGYLLFSDTFQPLK